MSVEDLRSGPAGVSTPAGDPAARDPWGDRAFEALVLELSSRFVSLPPEEVDAAIEDALLRVCEPLRIDAAVLWQWKGSTPDVIVPTHAYAAPGIPGPRSRWCRHTTPGPRPRCGPAASSV